MQMSPPTRHQISPLPLPTPPPAAAPVPAPPIFSAAAAARVRELVLEEGKPALKLRLSVSGGGCSGFQYAFEFDEQQDADDLLLERDGASLLIDALSLPLLAGAEVDYVDDLSGAQFVVRNPNATGTCGCGTSFTA